MELVTQILTWLGLAFLAGFVGQFGKTLTQKILARRRERDAETNIVSVPPLANAISGKSEKMEKKRAKTDLKRHKKRKGTDES